MLFVSLWKKWKDMPWCAMRDCISTRFATRRNTLKHPTTCFSQEVHFEPKNKAASKMQLKFPRRVWISASSFPSATEAADWLLDWPLPSPEAQQKHQTISKLFASAKAVETLRPTRGGSLLGMRHPGHPPNLGILYRFSYQGDFTKTIANYLLDYKNIITWDVHQDFCHLMKPAALAGSRFLSKDDMRSPCPDSLIAPAAAREVLATGFFAGVNPCDESPDDELRLEKPHEFVSGSAAGEALHETWQMKGDETSVFCFMKLLVCWVQALGKTLLIIVNPRIPSILHIKTIKKRNTNKHIKGKALVFLWEWCYLPLLVTYSGGH